MFVNLLLWLAAIVVVDYLTRERHKPPTGVDHPAVARSQAAYRRGSLLGRCGGSGQPRPTVRDTIGACPPPRPGARPS